MTEKEGFYVVGTVQSFNWKWQLASKAPNNVTRDQVRNDARDIFR
jgi:hypothetical protein